MIEKFKLEKALLDKLVSIVGSSNIAVNGSSFEPSPTQDYYRETCLMGETNITLSPGDEEDANGIYQIDVCTPISKGKFYNAGFTDALKVEWTKGLTAGVEFNGQKVSINEVSTPPMLKDDTHLISPVRIYFRVIG